MTHKFKVIADGNLYRWQRQYGCNRRVSSEAWLSDIEAAAVAYKVAATYPDSEIELTPNLAQAVGVWLVVEQYAATVPVATR